MSKDQILCELGSWYIEHTVPLGSKIPEDIFGLENIGSVKAVKIKWQGLWSYMLSDRGSWYYSEPGYAHRFEFQGLAIRLLDLKRGHDSESDPAYLISREHLRALSEVLWKDLYSAVSDDYDSQYLYFWTDHDYSIAPDTFYDLPEIVEKAIAKYFEMTSVSLG